MSKRIPITKLYDYHREVERQRRVANFSTAYAILAVQNLAIYCHDQEDSNVVHVMPQSSKGGSKLGVLPVRIQGDRTA